MPIGPKELRGWWQPHSRDNVTSTRLCVVLELKLNYAPSPAYDTHGCLRWNGFCMKVACAQMAASIFIPWLRRSRSSSLESLTQPRHRLPDASVMLRCLVSASSYGMSVPVRLSCPSGRRDHRSWSWSYAIAIGYLFFCVVVPMSLPEIAATPPLPMEEAVGSLQGRYGADEHNGGFKWCYSYSRVA